MACEAAMFRATAGVNTHKGSIFSLGLLCAAIGRLYQLRQPIAAETLCTTAADFCRGLTTRELRQNNLQLTAGQRLYQQLGLTGARGEAEAGYPLVIRHALPHYRALLAQGRDPELALLDTLLLLMSLNGDTNVASRGGRTVCAGYSSRRRSYYIRAAYGRLTISFISTGSISNALNAISAQAVAPIC